jgi:hypothetical protein
VAGTKAPEKDASPAVELTAKFLPIEGFARPLWINLYSKRTKNIV